MKLDTPIQEITQDFGSYLPENYADLSPMEKAKAMRQAKKAARDEAGEEGEVTRLNPIEKAKLKPTPMNCLKAKCYECMGGDSNWRWQIGNCTSYLCPIRPIRPFQSMEGKEKG